MILLVEDDQAQSMLLARFFVNEGFETRLAEDGVAATVLLASDTSIELVITDLVMPKMDGMELIRTIRRDAALANLPIIAVSAYRTPRNNMAILEAGANFFVPKPIDYPALLEYVEHFVAPVQASASLS